MNQKITAKENTPLIYEDRYVLKKYYEKDVDGSFVADDRTVLEVFDQKTKQNLTLTDTGLPGLDRVSIDGKIAEIGEIKKYRELYKEIKADLQQRVIPSSLQWHREHLAEVQTVALSRLPVSRAEAKTYYAVFHLLYQDTHLSVGDETKKKLDPDFAPEGLTFSFDDLKGNALYEIHLSTPDASAWAQSLIHLLKLDELYADVIGHEKRNGFDGEGSLTLGIFDSPLKRNHQDDSQEVGFYPPVLEALLDGIFDDNARIFGNLHLLLEFHEEANETGEPLPFFGSIEISKEASVQLRKSIDVNGDGKIGNIHEAWKAYELAHAKEQSSLTTKDRDILQGFANTMAQVNVELGAVRVFGRVFSFLKPHPESKQKTCMSERRLFSIAEALRSFGPHMVRRWHEGHQGERPLHFIATTNAEHAIEPFGITVYESFAPFLWSGIAKYYTESNTLITGCGMAIEDQYSTAKHELGHAVDDWILPYDNENFAWDDYLSSQNPLGLITQAYESFAQTFFTKEMNDEEKQNVMRRVEGDAGLSQSFQMHNLQVVEWFAYLFQKPGRWRFASPELKEFLACYLGGKEVFECQKK